MLLSEIPSKKQQKFSLETKHFKREKVMENYLSRTKFEC